MLNGVLREGVKLIENGREFRVPCLLYADDLALCSESEPNLRRLVERFGRVCKIKGMKANVDKSKIMVVSEENTQCQIMFDGEQLE